MGKKQNIILYEQRLVPTVILKVSKKQFEFKSALYSALILLLYGDTMF